MTPTANGKHEFDPFGSPTRMIVLSYYDGATSGVIQFQSENGPTFYFEMPDEEVQLSRSNGTPRDYTFSPLPMNALDRLVVALSPHQTPSWPVWNVKWSFATPDIERDVDARIEAILSDAGMAQWLVSLPVNWTLDQFRPCHVRSPQPV